MNPAVGLMTSTNCWILVRQHDLVPVPSGKQKIILSLRPPFSDIWFCDFSFLCLIRWVPLKSGGIPKKAISIGDVTITNEIFGYPIFN